MGLHFEEIKKRYSSDLIQQDWEDSLYIDWEKTPMFETNSSWKKITAIIEASENKLCFERECGSNLCYLLV